MNREAPSRHGGAIERVRTERFWIPRFILDRTWQILRQDGWNRVESTVLWGGRRFDKEAVVMAVLYPCGRDVSFSRGLVHVGPDTTAEMGRVLRANEMTGLIQVHTHPGSGVGHSPTDDNFSISSAEGFLSLVWPEYAHLPPKAIADFGVHRLEPKGWRRLSRSEAGALLHVVESESFVWVPEEGDDFDRF